MKAVLKYIGALLLASSFTLAQSTAIDLEDIQVQRDGNNVRLRITVSAPVQPAVTTATRPDRLILDFPNTNLGIKAQAMAVNFGGVRSVRVALNPAVPLTTRIVVDLDRAAPYAISLSGNRISLTVDASASLNSSRHPPPAAATSGGLAGVFRRHNNPPPPVAPEDGDVPLPAPASAGAPIEFPSAPSSDGNTTSAQTASRPTASHPNRASLQEGTVFPGLGSPGSGQVPPTNIKTNAGFDSAKTGLPHTTSGPRETEVPLAPNSETKSLALPSWPASSSHSGAGASAAASQMPATPLQPAAPAQRASAESTEQSQDPAQKGSPNSAATGQIETQKPPAGEPEGTSAAYSQGPESPTVTTLQESSSDLHTVFRVKYVADGVAYLDGGRSSGLAEGMKLEVKDTELPAQQGAVANPDDPRVVAELEITAVADTSAVTDIRQPKRPVVAGDLAYLSAADSAALVQQRTLSATRKYPAVVTFTEGDPLEEEARAEVPRPPLPSINRARGRIGLDYLGTVSHGSTGLTSSDLGLVLRADITRINGTYWNLSGYWRGRLDARSSSSQPTLQDLINRTYHLSMTYDNPNSNWVAGFGRLYLPWASSLETIDGGYFGRRIARGTIAGLFLGSTPDPTSYSYNPNQEIGGGFVNFEGGDFDGIHYTSTSGVGVSMLTWQIDRSFVFFENNLSYKRIFAIYDSLQADSPGGNPAVPAPGAGLSRNFLTLRVQVTPRVELHFNHNYFRDVPTFDPTLVGTGLLDKYLFQGFSAGTRVEVVKHISVYGDLGSSSRTGDAKSSLNELFGVTFDRLPKLGLRADFHYSRFNSSFGDGSYKSFALSRSISDSFQLEVLAGQQNFTSLFSTGDRSRFVTTNLLTNLGAHYFIQGGLSINRGSLSYDQWSFTLGYRFDSKSRKK